MTRPDLNTCSAQDVFDYVLFKLREQKYASINNDMACAMRGSGGRCCAVGHLIPDDVYTDDMEGHTIDVQIDEPWFNYLGFHRFTELLQDLQRVHDTYLPHSARDPSRTYVEFEALMKRIAQDHCLVVS